MRGNPKDTAPDQPKSSQKQLSPVIFASKRKRDGWILIVTGHEGKPLLTIKKSKDRDMEACLKII